MLDHEKILKGLEEAYRKMLEFKIYKKTPVVMSIDGKIVKVSPEELLAELDEKQNNIKASK